MTIKVALEHRTSYTFDRPVRVFPHIVRLRPAPHSRTPIEAYSLRVEPADHFINWQQDAVGNFVCRLTFPNPMSQLTITVGLIADLKVINPFDFFIEDWAETWPSAGFSYPETLSDDLKPYLRPVDEHGTGAGPGELVQAWVRNFSMPEGTRTINALVELNRRINTDLGYSVRMEHGVQTPDFTLRTGVGSCRDFAWLLVSILRQLGLAARFVSGYLVQLASDVKALDGPSGPAADFNDLLAPAEGYIARAGWTRRRRCWPARVTSRWLPRHARRARHRSPAKPPPAVRCWNSPTPSPASTRTRASRCPTPTKPGKRLVSSAAASTSDWSPATSGSPWAVSLRSSRWITRSTMNGPQPPTARTSASGHPIWPPDSKRRGPRRG